MNLEDEDESTPFITFDNEVIWLELAEGIDEDFQGDILIDRENNEIIDLAENGTQVATIVSRAKIQPPSYFAELIDNTINEDGELMQNPRKARGVIENFLGGLF